MGVREALRTRQRSGRVVRRRRTTATARSSVMILSVTDPSAAQVPARMFSLATPVGTRTAARRIGPALALSRPAVAAPPRAGWRRARSPPACRAGRSGDGQAGHRPRSPGTPSGSRLVARMRRPVPIWVSLERPGLPGSGRCQSIEFATRCDDGYPARCRDRETGERSMTKSADANSSTAISVLRRSSILP